MMIQRGLATAFRLLNGHDARQVALRPEKNIPSTERHVMNRAAPESPPPFPAARLGLAFVRSERPSNRRRSALELSQ
jgi:hypothetical protein